MTPPGGVHSAADIELRSTDLVHGDLNPGNIFLRDGHVRALVDAEALGKGSRFHDLAALLVHARLWDGEPGACDALLSYADRHAAPGELEVSYASCVLGVLAFFAEHNREDPGTLLRKAAESLWRHQ